MPIRLLSIFFVVTTSVQVHFAIYFLMLGDGFRAIVDGQVFYCRDLLSSGSDDEVILLLFGLLLISVLLRFIKLGSPVSVPEAVVFVLVWIVGGGFLLFGLECGQLVITIRPTKPTSFGGFVLFGALSVLFFGLLIGGRANRDSKS
jgi:hypothetical protein